MNFAAGEIFTEVVDNVNDRGDLFNGWNAVESNSPNPHYCGGTSAPNKKSV